MYTLEQLQSKTFKELKEIGYQINALSVGDRRCRQNWIDALVGVKLPLLELLEASSAAQVELVQEPIEVQALEPIEVQVLELIEVQALELIENFPGVTFSPRFLACYFPPKSEKFHYQADADGQLSLLDFEVEFADEPPDPDDYPTEFEFRVAYDSWCDRNSDIDALEFSELLPQFLEIVPQFEEIEISLASMAEWAPCPDEWYEPVLVAREKLQRCPCGVVSAIQCDGTIATHFFADRIYQVPCHRHFFRCLTAARSPPGGDAVR